MLHEVEIAFPLHPRDGIGGLLSAGHGKSLPQHYDPNAGAKYWSVDFSRAEHPFFTSNSSLFGQLCPLIQQGQPTLLGADQWSCYWESGRFSVSIPVVFASKYVSSYAQTVFNWISVWSTPRCSQPRSGCGSQWAATATCITPTHSAFCSLPVQREVTSVAMSSGLPGTSSFPGVLHVFRMAVQFNVGIGYYWVTVKELNLICHKMDVQ